jgi:hypothetical protein
MKNTRILTILVLVVSLLVSSAYIASAKANTAPQVLPSTTQVQGLTYGEWLARWWQYTLELPVSENPLTNGTDSCMFKRFGNVGVLLANSSTGGPVSCEIPAGMMIYIEVLGVECSNLEGEPFYGGNEDELRACVQAFDLQNLMASIDDHEVKNLNKFIFLSPLYEFTNPEENILGVPAGTQGISMGSGAYLLIAPLSPGKHTIHVQGTFPIVDYTRDVTIDLTVSR